MDAYDYLSNCTGFDWDEHNSIKNWVKHKVSPSECEQIFFNQPLIVSHDIKHSKGETRFFALGKTDSNRKLFIAFTVRKNLIRVVSARSMSRKEKRSYEKHEKK
jgi:uncharacterized DUF497 family protein